MKQQGAKASKIMFPCKRRIYLNKSAGFERCTSFKINHKGDAKIDPNVFENHF